MKVPWPSARALVSFHNRAMAASADSLLALLVVVKSSRGASVVYAYPPAPVAVARTSVPIYPSARRGGAFHQSGDSTPTDVSSDDSSESDLGDDEHELLHSAGSNQYLGFSSAVLASLLSPSRELCDQPFELVVDHLGFVGHPVWLGDEEGTRQPETTVEETEEDMQNEENARGRTRQRSSSLTDKTPTAELSGMKLDVQSPEPTSSSATSPTSPIKLSRSHGSNTTLHPMSSLASSQHSHNSFKGAGQLLSFNFVCVIDTPPDSHLSSHLEGYYKDVVIPVTANLKALERSEKWLGKEAAKIRRTREKAAEKGQSAMDVNSILLY